MSTQAPSFSRMPRSAAWSGASYRPPWLCNGHWHLPRPPEPTPAGSRFFLASSAWRPGARLRADLGNRSRSPSLLRWSPSRLAVGSGSAQPQAGAATERHRVELRDFDSGARRLAMGCTRCWRRHWRCRRNSRAGRPDAAATTSTQPISRHSRHGRLPGAWLSPGQWGFESLAALWFIALGGLVHNASALGRQPRLSAPGQPFWPGVLWLDYSAGVGSAMWLQQIGNGATLLFCLLHDLGSDDHAAATQRTRCLAAMAVAIVAFLWQFVPQAAWPDRGVVRGKRTGAVDQPFSQPCVRVAAGSVNAGETLSKSSYERCRDDGKNVRCRRLYFGHDHDGLLQHFARTTGGRTSRFMLRRQRLPDGTASATWAPFKASTARSTICWSLAMWLSRMTGEPNAVISRSIRSCIPILTSWPAHGSPPMTALTGLSPAG